MRKIKELLPIKGEITLDVATHQYLVDGVKAEKQVSVTTLISGNFRVVNSTPVMVQGTEVHRELEQIITDYYTHRDKTKPYDGYSAQARLLFSFFKKHDNGGKIHVEPRFGMKVIFDDEKFVNVFGSPDCFVELVDENGSINFDIFEFKTSENLSTYNKWQLCMYRILLLVNENPRAAARMFLCNLSDCYDLSGVTPGIALEYLEHRIDYFLFRFKKKDGIGEQVDVDDVDVDKEIVALYQKWKEYSEVAENFKKMLESKAQEKLAEAKIESDAAFAVDLGGLFIKKTQCFKTSYNVDLIEKELPNAIEKKPYYRTTYSVE